MFLVSDLSCLEIYVCLASVLSKQQGIGATISRTLGPISYGGSFWLDCCGARRGVRARLAVYGVADVLPHNGNCLKRGILARPYREGVEVMIGKRRVTLLLTILTIVCAGTGLVTTPTQALAYEQDVADVGVFYEPLAPYGTWFTLDGYGQVWRPRHVHAQWRPYTDGRWLYTEYGWTWVSDWPWGWAPFHYGRWYSHPVYGWVWIPGTVWAPAWVAWRYAPGWAGWAPLPPEAVWTPGIGLTVTHIEVIQPTSYCFVESNRLLDRHMHRYIASPTSNAHLIRRTRDVTRYASTRQYVTDQSLSVEDIEKDTKTRVPRYRITEATSPATETTGRVRDRERTVAVFRPPVARAPRDSTSTGDVQPSAPPAEQRPESTSQEPRHPRRRLEDRSTTTDLQPQPETRPPGPSDQPAQSRRPRHDGQQDQAPMETGYPPVLRQPRPASQPQERRRRPVQSQEDQGEALRTPPPGGTDTTPPPRRLSTPDAPSQTPAGRPRRSPQTQRQPEEERRPGWSSPQGNMTGPPAGSGVLPPSRRTPMSSGPDGSGWSRQQQ